MPHRQLPRHLCRRDHHAAYGGPPDDSQRQRPSAHPCHLSQASRLGSLCSCQSTGSQVLRRCCRRALPTQDQHQAHHPSRPARSLHQQDLRLVWHTQSQSRLPSMVCLQQLLLSGRPRSQRRVQHAHQGYQTLLLIESTSFHAAGYDRLAAGSASQSANGTCQYSLSTPVLAAQRRSTVVVAATSPKGSQNCSTECGVFRGRVCVCVWLERTLTVPSRDPCFRLDACWTASDVRLLDFVLNHHHLSCPLLFSASASRSLSSLCTSTQ